VRTRLATLYKAPKETVQTFGFRTKFGGGRSTGFALIYDSEADLKRFEVAPTMGGANLSRIIGRSGLGLRRRLRSRVDSSGNRGRIGPRSLGGQIRRRLRVQIRRGRSKNCCCLHGVVNGMLWLNIDVYVYSNRCLSVSQPLPCLYVSNFALPIAIATGHHECLPKQCQCNTPSQCKTRWA
jgi:Ribosomal protein S24e